MTARLQDNNNGGKTWDYEFRSIAAVQLKMHPLANVLVGVGL